MSLGCSFFCGSPFTDPKIGRRSSDLLLSPWKPAGEGGRGAQRCQRATACYSFLRFTLDEWVYQTPWSILYMQMNKQVNYQELSVGKEKKVKYLIFPGDICYDQISSSSSQVRSIKYIIQSTRIYKTYCNSNLLRQVVFNYTYHFKKRNILSI